MVSRTQHVARIMVTMMRSFHDGVMNIVEIIISFPSPELITSEGQGSVEVCVEVTEGMLAIDVVVFLTYTSGESAFRVRRCLLMTQHT